jgi:stage V sporulation protein D (sporulation-specific penicillin-binding protein)
MELTDFESDPDLKAKWDTLTDEERSEYANKAWKNINISETFEPGSIYKPIVAAMALEEGVITPESTFVCNGSKQIAGLDKAISCWQHAGHGTIDVQGVLAGSCNVGMMDIISKLTPEVYLKYHHDFGFHQKTGIDLPGEAAADSDSLQYNLDTLHTAEMATSSFGQGFNCTALQALNAFNATINGGKLMRPYVVSQVVDADGKIVKENSPQVVRQVISQETSDYMRKAMQATVSPTGTAKKAVIQGYALGGKTGTAEQGARDKTNWTLSFISYLSVDSPDIVVMTVIHRPEDYYDGCDISPVPMLRGIMEKIINYKAIPPSTTSSDTGSDYGSNMIELKSYQGKNLKSSIEELIGLGLDFDIISAGGDTITNQYPAAGTAIEKGGKVMLSVQSNGTTATKEVPNVVGMDSQSAKEMLEAVGFSCYIYNINDAVAAENSIQTATTQEAATQATTEAVSEEDNATSTDNKLTVVEQSPAAGKKLEAGTILYKEYNKSKDNNKNKIQSKTKIIKNLKYMIKYKSKKNFQKR